MWVDSEQNHRDGLLKFERIIQYASRYLYWFKWTALWTLILHREINQYQNEIMLVVPSVKG